MYHTQCLNSTNPSRKFSIRAPDFFLVRIWAYFFQIGTNKCYSKEIFLHRHFFWFVSKIFRYYYLIPFFIMQFINFAELCYFLCISVLSFCKGSLITLLQSRLYFYLSLIINVNHTCLKKIEFHGHGIKVFLRQQIFILCFIVLV